MRGDPTFIGISPGSRHVGIAILRGKELVDVRTRLIAARTTGQRTAKLRSYLSHMIELHRPAAIGMKAMHPSRTSPGLDRVVREVKRLAGEHGVPLEEFPLGALKERLGLTGKANRLDMAKALASQHWALAACLREKDMRKNGYRVRLFEAVAAAEACSTRSMP